MTLTDECATLHSLSACFVSTAAELSRTHCEVITHEEVVNDVCVKLKVSQWSCYNNIRYLLKEKCEYKIIDVTDYYRWSGSRLC